MLLVSEMGSNAHPVSGPTWHMSAILLTDRTLYVCDPNWDPEANQDPLQPSPRLKELPGCRLVSLFSQYVRTNKTSTVGGVKNHQGNSVRGLGYRIDGMQITGKANSDQTCQQIACSWIHDCLTGRAGIKDTPNPNNWVYQTLNRQEFQNRINWSGNSSILNFLDLFHLDYPFLLFGRLVFFSRDKLGRLNP